MYTLVYTINKEENPETVYINLTNSCTNACIFCLRNQKDDVCGKEMWHDDEYELDDIINQFKIFEKSVKEVVFCGYGEPFLRKEMMKNFCKYLRKNYPYNGHANNIYNVNVVEEFKGLIDSVSVSLNASNEDEYDEICKPKIKNAFKSMLDFSNDCKKAGIDVSMSVVTGFDKIHSIDVKKCEEIAHSIGAKFREREFITNGY